MRRHRLSLFACVALLLLATCQRKGNETSAAGDLEHEVLGHYDPDDPHEGDQQVLAELERAGADLSKATHVIHYAYFPDRRSAEHAHEAAGAAGPAASVRPPGAGDQSWVLVVEQTIVPSLENISTAREEISAIAATSGGEYDGWEAAVTP